MMMARLPMHIPFQPGLITPALGLNIHGCMIPAGSIMSAPPMMKPLVAFQLCARQEGIIPALEPSHALAYVSTMIGDMSADQIVILNMCGRGDKDLGAVLPILDKLGRL